MDASAYYRRVQLDFTKPGKPTVKAQLKSGNRRLRDECLKVHQFLSLGRSKQLLKA